MVPGDTSAVMQGPLALPMPRALVQRIAPVQERYPVRYWVTLAYMTGLPNFVHFDPTGLTHKQGLVNLSSLISLAYTAIAALMLVGLTALSREGLFVRRFNFKAGLWIAMFLGLGVSTLLEPAPKFFTPRATDTLTSFYQLLQWAMGFLMILTLYSRETAERAPTMITQFIVRMCWATMIPIWIMVPLAPSLAYISEDGTRSTVARLGGVALHPSMVALMASVIFLHSLLLLRGPRRLLGCAFALLSMVLTYTRSTEIIFLLVLWIYLLFLSRGRSLRWLGVATLLIAIAAGALFSQKLDAYLSRGQSAADVSSGSGRTLVWEVGMRAWAERPLLGYGFISGPRNAFRDNWKQAHWLPPHAHNEFVQALMSGGLVSGGLIIWLYLYMTWKGLQRARADPQTTFFFLVWLELLFISIASTNITTGFGKPSILLIACFLMFVVEDRRAAATQPSLRMLARPALSRLSATEA